MLRLKSLRAVALVTLCFFTLFIGGVDYANAAAQQNEDLLLKAHRLYQEGDYEGSIKILGEFIGKLKAVVEQKKNVAEAFYLLAKIYFEVGDDNKVEENLMKVFETYPAFKKDESNLGFKEQVEKVRGQFLQEKEAEAEEKALDLKKQEDELKKEKPEKKKVILQPTVKKKKKKFPILLVIGGLVLVGLVVALAAGGGGGDKPKKDEYDIRGNWVLDAEYAGGTDTFYFTFSGSMTSGIFVDHDGERGTYIVTGRSASFEYNDYPLRFQGNFSTMNQINGTWTIPGVSSGNFVANRGGPGGVASTGAGESTIKNLIK